MGQGFEVRWAAVWVWALVSSWSLVVSAQGAAPGQFDHLFEQDLNIEIEKEVERTAPPLIAVPPARLPDGDPGAHGEPIAEIMRFDLQISGLFSKMNPAHFKDFEPKEGFLVDQIDFNRWQASGAAYLIKSRYKEVEGQISLEMGFFDIKKREQIELKWKPTSAERDKVRGAVHSFINAVVEHMTGSPGIFGTRLALAQWEAGQKHILAMDMDGGNRSRISNNGSINVLPSWGDSGGIYYTSYLRDNPDLYFAEGGQTRLISSVPGTNHGAALCGGKIAVTLSMGSTNTDIYLLDPSNGRVRARLTDHWGIDTSPSWSPDCSRIAFVSDRGGNPQIYVMNASGGDQKRLTFSGRNNTTPAWSPKGDEIAFTGYTGAGAEIFTTDMQGFIRRVTFCRGHCEHPSWSPDANYMAYIEQRGSTPPQLFITPLHRSRYHSTRITHDGGVYATPSWQR